MKGRFVVMLLLAVLILDFSDAATLHGGVYDSEYNLIKNVQLEINTTPKQNYISKNGLYFFNVDLGAHEITLEKFYQGQLVYSTSKIIIVNKDGEFNIDLIVDALPGVELPLDEDNVGPSIITLLRARYGYLFYVAIGFVFSMIILVIYLYFKYRMRSKKKEVKIVSEPVVSKTPEKVEDTTPEPKDVPSEDLAGILKIIKEEGGRTTQKDIRKQIPLSEAKISLMVSELEAKGKVQKIKKGRGNIIILK